MYLNESRIMTEYVPCIATCLAVSWWWRKYIEARALTTRKNLCNIRNLTSTILHLVHKGGIESIVFAFLTWLAWLFVVFLITGVSADRPPSMFENVIFSTLHCVLALVFGWGWVWEHDWSKNHENRRNSAVFCGFCLTYMFSDLYMIRCMMLGGYVLDKSILVHHTLCILGLYYAFTTTHQTQLSNTITLYETTGISINLHYLLVDLNISSSHWLFVLNGVSILVCFTFFRIYLGTKLALHFILDPKVESFSFVLSAVLFHSVSFYWYYLLLRESSSTIYGLAFEEAPS